MGNVRINRKVQWGDFVQVGEDHAALVVGISKAGTMACIEWPGSVGDHWVPTDKLVVIKSGRKWDITHKGAER